jgi:hypothetical protein
MTDATAAAGRHVTAAQRKKMAQIKTALDKSDRAVATNFARFDQSVAAAKSAGKPVGSRQARELDGVYRELLKARDRLDKLQTGLQAQSLYRHSLVLTAEGVDQWRKALRSTNPDVIAQCDTRMGNAFAAAQDAGQQAAHALERGH